MNVALVDVTRTLACATTDPMAGETFWSDGSRAFVRRGGQDEPVAPSARSRLVDIDCDGPTDRPLVCVLAAR